VELRGAVVRSVYGQQPLGSVLVEQGLMEVSPFCEEQQHVAVLFVAPLFALIQNQSIFGTVQ